MPDALLLLEVNALLSFLENHEAFGDDRLAGYKSPTGSTLRSTLERFEDFRSRPQGAK